MTIIIKEEENPYWNIIVNEFDKENIITSQMEQRSILSTIVNFVQYDSNPRDFYNFDVKAIDQKNHRKIYDRLKKEDWQVLELDFGDTLDKLKGEHLACMMELSEVLCTKKFDENSDLSTTYLGGINMTRLDKIKVEERFPISEQGYTLGKLLDGTECQILLDMAASKSFMPKKTLFEVKSLHLLPKFASTTQRIKVGNGQYVSVLFIIPIMIDIHGHRFEIFKLVSEIHENMDLVLRIKNIFELGGIINLRESCFSFLNRLIPFFPKQQVILKPREQQFIKVEAPFIGEISGLAIVKVSIKRLRAQ